MSSKAVNIASYQRRREVMGKYSNKTALYLFYSEKQQQQQQQND